MTLIDMAADGLKSNLDMVKMTLADFSDADMLARPAPAANHAAWQLGHLINAEANMLNMVAPGSAPALPEGFAQKFSKDAAKSDDPAAFLPKSELLAHFDKVRAATVQWVKGLTPEDLEKPGPERVRQLAPTWGRLALLFPVHTAMHLGQFQVIRRKLGKPVLF